MFSASDDFHDGASCPHSDGNVIHGGRTGTGTGTRTGTSKVYYKKHVVSDESKCTPRKGGSVRKQGLPSCRRWSQTREISQHRKFDSKFKIYWTCYILVVVHDSNTCSDTPASWLAGFISPDRDMYCISVFQITLFLIFKSIC